MRRRTLGLLGLLLLVGGALGWLWADQRDGPQPAQGPTSAAPSPLAADGPAVPGSVTAEVQPDSDLPPLGEGITTHEETLGPAGAGIVVPVPDGWQREELVPQREAQWTAPGDPAGAYSFRVRLLAEARTLAQRVAQRQASLGQDPDLSGVEVLDTSGDTLVARFVNRGYQRLVVVRWVSFSGGTADLEIAAAGRLVDEPGLEELVARAASGVRQASQ